MSAFLYLFLGIGAMFFFSAIANKILYRMEMKRREKVYTLNKRIAAARRVGF